MTFHLRTLRAGLPWLIVAMLAVASLLLLESGQGQFRPSAPSRVILNKIVPAAVTDPICVTAPTNPVCTAV